MLVRDLFVAALENIGVIGLGDTPEAEEFNKCLRHCNLMLNSWSGRNLMLMANIQETFQLHAGQRVYTIGVGGDFNTSKPIVIDSAFVQDSANVRYQVAVVDTTTYDLIDDALISSARPELISYDPGLTQQSVQTGTISCYGIPDQDYLLIISSQKQLSEFAKLSDNVTFMPIYYDAIVQNLSVKLWRAMGRKGLVPSDLIVSANRSMQVVENINCKKPNMRSDLPGSTRHATDNIMSGSWMT